jgi:RNA polymerase sigma-70 factor (ECF subfamily)
MVSDPLDSSPTASPSVESAEELRGGGVSKAGFRAIYERHAAEILRFAIRYTGRREVAEELTSEAFLKMYQYRDRVDPERAAAWLTATVKNLAIDYWRHADTERRHLQASRPEAELSPERRWEELLAHPSLKAEHRACLTLHYVHGMERKEISSHTGLTDNQVKSCLQYGLKLLRSAFGVKP